MKTCPMCLEEKDDTEFYKKGSKYTHSYCKSCVNKQTKQRQRDLKRKAVEYKGGVCSICDGVFHPACYDFHHRDPKEKDFTIGHSKMTSFDNVKKELDKCELVCSNCHRELHAKY